MSLLLRQHNYRLPFALQPGCGHSGFRDLLLVQVLNIDYAYRSITLHDPHLSTCDSIVLGGRGNGFVVEHWRAPYLNPSADNVFMLLGCSTQSPLFQGFPAGNHVPCRNVSGMGCEEYYGCQGLWMDLGLARMGLAYGTGPPICLHIPLHLSRKWAIEWTYGIRVKYNVEASNDSFCKACEATGGSCGHDVGRFGQLCMCGSWNSTSNCDTIMKLSVGGAMSTVDEISGSLIAMVGFWLLSFRM
ncbi:hypothetical protein HanHA300_Chr00c0606g0789621 [Helianthus annuus]|nr:hypothetical protein HanHA300_Chr00c0606g0789621 [Helianthus annuus]